MIERNVGAGRLFFTTDYAEALADADIVFICVARPAAWTAADLRYVRMAAESIAQMMTHPLIVVNKSTVPVGTGDWVATSSRAAGCRSIFLGGKLLPNSCARGRRSMTL